MRPKILTALSLATALAVLSPRFAAACANQGNSCPAYCNGAAQCTGFNNGLQIWNTCLNSSGNAASADNTSPGGGTFSVRGDYVGGTCNPGSYSAPQVRVRATFNAATYDVRDLTVRVLDASGNQLIQQVVCVNCPASVDYTSPGLGAEPARVEIEAREAKNQVCTSNCVPDKFIHLYQCIAGCARCVNAPAQCDDGNPCTADRCDPTVGVGCTHTPNPGPVCDDHKPCTTNDRCQADGVCRGEPNCNDGNPCTKDVCTVYGCAFTAKPNGTSCSDGNACTAGDTCQSGQCVGWGVICNDGNPCTVDGCDPARGCTATPAPDGTVCSDQNACNGTETCQGGTCRAGAPPNCDDANTCTTDRCEPDRGCRHVRVVDCVDDLLPGIFAATIEDH